MTEFGVEFDVSETEFTIRSGQGDMEPGRHYAVKLRNSDANLVVSGRFDDILRKLSTAWPVFSNHVEERKIRSRSGQIFGTDRWGYLNNGMRWRYIVFSTGDAAGYEPSSPKEAILLDRVVSSACLGTPTYRLRSEFDDTKRQSPTEVVSEFLGLETEGVRLTKDGWYKTAHFFVQAGFPPSEPTVVVMSGKYKYSVYEHWIKGNEAEILSGYDDLGMIDSMLRYMPPDAGYFEYQAIYHLVLTDKHWEIEPAEAEEKEVTGPLAWRIEKAIPTFWLNVHAALRYVQESRARTTDPAIKRNADKTIAKLKNLR